MRNPSRRVFVMTVMAGGSALTATRVSAQAAAPALAETDPQAAALGYKADGSKVDKAKYPQHVATQVCSGCNFYQGKPTEPTAPCQLFAGKKVVAKGWCTAWAKKA
ncbi:MAG: high-potential iron-sulfur protein [Rhizobacter sp.]|nr:high-potential iron-sulfur protein [Rhizobacter sp.]